MSEESNSQNGQCHGQGLSGLREAICPWTDLLTAWTGRPDAEGPKSRGDQEGMSSETWGERGWVTSCCRNSGQSPAFGGQFIEGDQKLPWPRDQREASGVPIGGTFCFLPVRYLLQVAADTSPPLTSSPLLWLI